MSYNLATLIVLEFLQTSLQPQQTIIKNNEVELLIKEKTLILPLPENWRDCARRLQISEIIKGRSLTNLEDCFGLYVLREVLLKHIESASLFKKEDQKGEQWVLEFWLGGKKRQKVLTQDPKSQWNQLLVAQAILDGYSLTEVVGSHIMIHTPSGGRRRCTRDTCDCIEFHRYRTCLHIKIVQYYLNNRTLFHEKAEII